MNVSKNSLIGVGFFTLLSFLLAGNFLSGADEKPAAKTEAATAAKKKAEAKGRIPQYYGEVVSGEQKEKIYAIQAKYAADIKKLEEQLEAMKDARELEIEALLSPEQKARISKLQAEAKAKRAATVTKSKGSESTAKPAPEPGK